MSTKRTPEEQAKINEKIKATKARKKAEAEAKSKEAIGDMAEEQLTEKEEVEEENQETQESSSQPKQAPDNFVILGDKVTMESVLDYAMEVKQNLVVVSKDRRSVVIDLRLLFKLASRKNLITLLRTGDKAVHLEGKYKVIFVCADTFEKNSDKFRGFSKIRV
jgi:hypothetical protein